MQRLADRFVDQYAHVRRSFRYRAFGGDDNTMPWHDVEVVQAPEIEELTIRLTPPAYTGQPPMESGRHIRAWEGTAITVAARVSKPVAGVQWESTLGSECFLVPPELSADRREFTAPRIDGPLIATEDGSFWFTLVDTDGIVRREALRCELQVVPDRRPAVQLLSPAVNAAFTADAVVPLRGVVTDDLGIDTVQLRFADRTITLSTSESMASGSEDVRRFEFDWHLGGELQPGEVVEYEVIAHDLRPQSGTSGPRQLVIVSTAELVKQLQQRRNLVVEQLDAAVRSQREVLAQVEAALARFTGCNQLEAVDRQRVSSIELNQSHVYDQLYADREGLLRQIDDWFEQLASNRVDVSQLTTGIEPLRSGLEALRDDVMNRIADQLSVALRSLRQAEPTDPNTATAQAVQALKVSRQLQAEAVAKTEALLAALQHNDELQRMIRQLERLRRQQAELSGDTARVPTVGRDPHELSAEERGRLRRLAAQQGRLLQDFNELQQSLEQAAEAGGAAAGTPPQRALQHARQSLIGRLMRDSRNEIEQNRIGQAVSRQQRAERALGSVLDLLVGAQPGEEGQEGHEGQESQSAEGETPSSAAAVPLEVLEEIRDLQLEINRRTRDLADQSSRSPTREQELEALQVDQQRLADRLKALNE